MGCFCKPAYHGSCAHTGRAFSGALPGLHCTRRREQARDDVEWMRQEVQRQLHEERDREVYFDEMYRCAPPLHVLTLRACASPRQRRTVGGRGNAGLTAGLWRRGRAAHNHVGTRQGESRPSRRRSGTESGWRGKS